MKGKVFAIGALLTLAVLALLFTVGSADSVPQGVRPTETLLDYRGTEVVEWVWVLEIDGATCVYVGGDLECFCPCDAECVDIPEVVPTPDPTPEVKEACNRGVGNGAEDCEPGNSGGKPGKAGEGNE